MIEKKYFDEYLKCAVNPSYAIEKYLTIWSNTSASEIPFKLTINQQKLISSVERYRFNIAKKSRQVGGTSVMAAYIAVSIAFKWDVSIGNSDIIMIVTNMGHIGQEILRLVRKFLMMLPRWVWGEEYYGNSEKDKKSIFKDDKNRELRLGPRHSRIVYACSSRDGLRGFRPTHIYFDEAAYIDMGDELFSASMASLEMDGKVTIISTPNGYDRFFRRVYQQTWLMKNDFHLVDMKWYYDSRFNRDLVWTYNNNTISEKEFTLESINDRLYEGLKPMSPWYEDMCRGLNNNILQISQELDGKFVSMTKP